MKPWQKLFTYFAPPNFQNEEQKRQAWVLHTLICNLIAVLMLVLLLGALIFIEKIISGIAITLTILASLGAFFLLHRRQLKLASLLFIGIIWMVATSLAWISGGIHSPNISFYIAIVIVSGLLLGVKGSIASVGISLTALLVMALAEKAGYQFPQVFAFPPFAIWLIMLINIGGILLPVNLTLKSLTETSSHLQKELDERRLAETAAHQHAEERSLLYEFGIAIAKGTNLYETLGQVQAQLTKLIPGNIFFVALYDESTDTLDYPIFFTNNLPVEIPSRQMSTTPGITGAVINQCTTLYLGDVTLPAVEAAYHPIRRPDVNTHTFLGVPLLANDKCIGAMSVQHDDIDAYSPDQIRLFEALAVQTGLAIEKVRLIDQLQTELSERKRAETVVRQERDLVAERRKLLEKVIEIGKQTAQITDLRECLRMAHYCLQHELGFDRVGLFLYDPSTNIVQGAFGTDRQGQIEDTTWFIQRVAEYEAWTQALKEPSGLIIQNDYDSKHQTAPDNEMHGVKQHVTVSAWAGVQPIALIAVDNVISGRSINPDTIEALRLYAGYVGLTIRNARLNAELERRVQERTAQLEVAMSELESFSYSVGHDLRAPLRGMRGFSQIIMDENGDQLDAEAKTNLQRIILAAKNMGELIDALLEFSRLTRTPLKRSHLDLTTIANRVNETLARAYPQRQVQVNIEAGLTANADEKLTEVVLKNLFDNAWKFTSKTPNAEITFGKQEKNGKTAFYLRDNGAGFEMTHAGKLFGAFERLHRVDEFPGHGAGLAIVHRIINRHGGKIWAKGKVNMGATFWFTLE